MCTNHNVHHSLFQVRNGLFLLRSCPEPAHQVNPHRKILHSLRKRIVMLLRQDRCRNQISHLFSILDCLKSSPDSNLGLAVTDITADQPVHDFMALHILLDCLDGKQLILCLLKGEHLLKLPLPYRIFTVDKAILSLPPCIQRYQILGNHPDCTAHP